MNTWGGNITVSREVVGYVQVKYQNLHHQKFILEFFFAVDVKVWTGKLNFTLHRK